MLATAFELVVLPPPHTWTLEDEENAHLINTVLDEGLCHCGIKLCGSWRRAIAQQNDKRKWDFALLTSGMRPRPLIT